MEKVVLSRKKVYKIIAPSVTCLKCRKGPDMTENAFSKLNLIAKMNIPSNSLSQQMLVLLGPITAKTFFISDNQHFPVR